MPAALDELHQKLDLLPLDIAQTCPPLCALWSQSPRIPSNHSLRYLSKISCGKELFFAGRSLNADQQILWEQGLFIIL
jgi:hypothetical protein